MRGFSDPPLRADAHADEDEDLEQCVWNITKCMSPFVLVLQFSKMGRDSREKERRTENRDVAIVAPRFTMAQGLNAYQGQRCWNLPSSEEVLE